MMRSRPLSLLLLCVAAGAPAQLKLPEPQPIVGARMPALSPDGKRLAFVYRGDIWLSEARGGRSTPLTQHVESDGYPMFSPDGQWLSFASKRNGNWDLFVLPVDGGGAKQLTFHSGTEAPHAWSPDGQRLLFSAKRDTINFALYEVELATLRTRRLLEDYAQIGSPAYSPDGQHVVYGRYGFHWTRPRYTGSAASQVWLFNVNDRTRRALSQDQFQHLWTRFLPDGKNILNVTVAEATPSASNLDASFSEWNDNPLRTPNLWTVNLEGKPRQLTSFTGGAVRAPSVASKSGDIAFEYGADLWLLRAGKKTPQKIKLLAAADEKQTSRRREKLTTGVTEAEPSPDGKTFVFGLRGDIWSIAIEKPKGVAGRSAEIARRLTEWAGEDADFSWAPDGKKLYFISDREFYTRIYELELATLKVRSLWNRNQDVDRVRVSPDGKHLSFWVSGAEGGLYLLDLENGEPRRLVNAPGAHWRGQGGGEYEWSPDLRWIAYCLRGESRAWNIWIIPTEGGIPRNVSRLYAHHSQPAWSPDGKYLFFQSNRDGLGLYALPLTKEPIRSADHDMKFEKSTNAVKVAIEFEDISRRIRKVASQNPQSDLMVSPEGQILFLSEGDVWSVSYDGKETKRLTNGGGKSGLRLSKDGKRAFYMANGDLFTFKLDDRKEEKVTFTADWERDVKAERRAAFTQFWRSYQRGFYDPFFHGRNWEEIRTRYEPLLSAVETADDFATVLQMMIGELECSHAEVTPNGATPSPVTPHLGFTLDYTHTGPGLKVAQVPHGAPAWYPQTEIRPGEIVLSINGRDVSLDETLYDWVNDRQDRELEFLVSTNGTREGARTVRYKVLTQGEWNELNYDNRVERMRRYIEEKSEGKVGYLHLAAMGHNNQTQFERQAYEYIVGKEAMIIDVRFNNGGNIADTLIDWLERKPYGYVRPRDGAREPSPFHAWDRRMVVLINEHSFSNAEIFAYAMRARGLATLIGVATPGYVIWTDGLRLVEGTNARMPMTGAYRLDGTPLENHGEPPDLLVGLSPDDYLAERDPQLDKALEVLRQPAIATR